MRKFKIKVPSEKKMRKFAKEELSMTKIMVEMAPFTFISKREVSIKLAPMAYVSDLKGFIFQRLEYLLRYKPFFKDCLFGYLQQ